MGGAHPLAGRTIRAAARSRLLFPNASRAAPRGDTLPLRAHSCSRPHGLACPILAGAHQEIPPRIARRDAT